MAKYRIGQLVKIKKDKDLMNSFLWYKRYAGKQWVVHSYATNEVCKLRGCYSDTGELLFWSEEWLEPVETNGKYIYVAFNDDVQVPYDTYVPYDYECETPVPETVHSFEITGEDFEELFNER